MLERQRNEKMFMSMTLLDLVKKKKHCKYFIKASFINSAIISFVYIGATVQFVIVQMTAKYVCLRQKPMLIANNAKMEKTKKVYMDRKASIKSFFCYNLTLDYRNQSMRLFRDFIAIFLEKYSS